MMRYLILVKLNFKKTIFLFQIVTTYFLFVFNAQYAEANAVRREVHTEQKLNEKSNSQSKIQESELLQTQLQKHINKRWALMYSVNTYFPSVSAENVDPNYSFYDFGKTAGWHLDYEFYKKQSDVYYERTEFFLEKIESSEGGLSIKNKKRTLQQWFIASTQTQGLVKCLFGAGLGFGLSQFETESIILTSKAKSNSQLEPQYGWLVNSKFQFKTDEKNMFKDLFLELGYVQNYGAIFSTGTRKELFFGVGFFL